MTPRTRYLLAGLVAWTVFVWGTRISNAWRSTTESTGAKLSSTLLAGAFLAFAAATTWILWRTRRWPPERPLDRPMGLLLQAFAVWTVGVWLVRGAAILLADHDVPFKVVHTLLALISIALAVPAWRVGARKSSPEVVAG